MKLIIDIPEEVYKDIKAWKINKHDFRIPLSCILEGIPYEERSQGEWIDANKQIPEDCITVLIWFEYYRYGDYNCMYQTFGLGYTIDGKWSPFINGETGWRDAHIIAWQPIEPYEADMRGGAE